jgi:hypothetical protein
MVGRSRGEIKRWKRMDGLTFAQCKTYSEWGRWSVREEKEEENEIGGGSI